MPGQPDFPAQQPQQQFISLAIIRGILFRQRWLIAGVLVAAILGGLIITLLATPVYEAQAKVKVEPYGTFVLEGQDVGQEVAPNQLFTYLATQVEVIKSRSLAERIVADLNLDKRTDLLGKDVDEGRAPGMNDGQWAEAKKQRAVSLLTQSVTADVPTGNWIVTIGFRSDKPVLAAEIANAYADAFVSSGTRQTVDDNQYAITYLQEQIVDVRGRLEQAEQSANAFARNSGIIVQPVAGAEEGSASTTTLTSINLASINQRVSEARAARIAAEQRWRSIQNLPAAQLPEVQSNSVLQNLIADRTGKAAELTELRQRYNDDFPQITTLLAQIETLDRQIDRISSDVKSTVRNQYTVALNQERALTAELDALTGETLGEQDQQVRLNVLDREAQALREQLQALLTRYNQVNSAANVNSGTLSKLDAATIPTQPFSPNIMKNLALALVFGIAMAGGLAVLRETLDERIRSLEDVETRIGVPLLGHTPYVDEGDIDVAGGNRFSALIEAYSSIRATIDFTLPRNRNLLHLTSSQAAEGKSTTALILAELFASLGRKTLLVDVDLRRPSIASLLNTERPKIGLVEVLLGHVEMDAALLKGVQDNLSILPVGEIPPNPTELIGSPEFAAFLRRCREEYSLVILDSSPVMGLADAPMIAGMVDATVFVLEANRVPYGQARSAVRRVRLAGGNVLGVILTKYRALEAGESYNYQYAYYQYGSEKT